MANLKLKITISHNEVTEDFSVMCLPSTLSVELNEEKTNTWNELKEVNPNIIYVWAQKIWDMQYPNTFGKVVNVKVLN